MKFEVWCTCRTDCTNYEGERIVLTTEDPIEAIRLAWSLHDKLHEAFVKPID